jgi:prevent-host-death family protein
MFSPRVSLVRDAGTAPAKIKKICHVVTRDYIKAMKKKAKPLVHERSAAAGAPMVLKDAIALPGLGLSFPVRVAKAKLSALLELVAGGQEVTITSDGQPKALLSPVGKKTERRVFTGTREHLKNMPPWRGGPSAEEIIREDRDGRG